MILKVRDEQDFNLTLKQNIDCEKGVIELLVTTWNKAAHTTETRVFSAEKFRDALDYYHQKEVEMFNEAEAPQQKREFRVKTPLGELRIQAKHGGGDILTDYPGVYVDLIREGRDPEMIACVEYDSGDGTMLTTAYDTGCDDPIFIHHHDLNDGEDEDGEGDYTASIREATSGLYVVEDEEGAVELGEKGKRLLFYDECEAEDTLERLNDGEDGCYVLLREDGEYAKRRE